MHATVCVHKVKLTFVLYVLSIWIGSELSGPFIACVYMYFCSLKESPQPSQCMARWLQEQLNRDNLVPLFNLLRFDLV